MAHPLSKLKSQLRKLLPRTSPKSPPPTETVGFTIGWGKAKTTSSHAVLKKLNYTPTPWDIDSETEEERYVLDAADLARVCCELMTSNNAPEKHDYAACQLIEALLVTEPLPAVRIETMGKALAKPRQWTIARCDGKVWKPIYTEQQAALVAFPIRLKVRLDVKFSFPNGSDEEAEQDMEREDSGTEWDE